MADEKRSGRSTRSAVLYTPVAVLLIGVVTIFGISVFFRISDIDVRGAKKYTVEQIVSASGIDIGDNLVFVDAYASAEKIKTNLPYLNDVLIEKIVPDKVSINVTESQPIAVLRFMDTWWLLDQKARVLEVTNADMAAKKIVINGLSPAAIRVGQQLVVDDSYKTRLQFLSDILTAIQQDGIAGGVNAIDVSNVGGISFTYMDRFTVIMGSGEDAEFKLVRMHNVINQLQTEDKGKIDVSQDKTTRFIPEEAYGA